MRVNYGQDPYSVHAMVGSVALAGAMGGLWSVEGGNKRVAEELLKKSGAGFVQAQVNSVTLVEVDGGSKYSVAFNRVEKPEEPTFLFTEGANGGESKRVPVHTAEEAEEFDAVILATPMTRDKSSIQLRGLPVQPTFLNR